MFACSCGNCGVCPCQLVAWAAFAISWAAFTAAAVSVLTQICRKD